MAFQKKHRKKRNFSAIEMFNKSMKTQILSLLTLSACLATPLHAADSKHTAKYIITNSAEYEGKEVSLDVAFLRPVHWKSPNSEISFFRASTKERGGKEGGFILVAIRAADSEKFSRKYGLNESRRDTDTLKGVLRSARARGAKRGNGVWVLDTTGRLQDLLKDGKFELPDEKEDK